MRMSGDSLRRVQMLLGKEWRHLLGNRLAVLLALLLPLLLVALLLFLLVDASALAGGAVSTNGSTQSVVTVSSLTDGSAAPGALSLGELLQARLANQFMLLFFLLVLPASALLAATRMREEKRQRTLEPLLTTPLSAGELLAGLVLAVTLPGVLLTWGSYALYVLLARWLVLSDAVYSSILNVPWLLGMLLVVPLLAVLSACLGLLVALRSRRRRGVGQLGVLLVLPMLLLFFA
jgi:ABC-type Na+ efflux pump permease subunit